MEFHILNTLNFDLNLPTPLRFLERYIKFFNDDATLMHYAQFLIELSLVDIRMNQYTPSFLAAAAISLAYKCKLRKVYATQDIDREAEGRLLAQLGYKDVDLHQC